MGSQLGGQEDGGRAVGTADDADGSSLSTGEAHADSTEEGYEDTQLCGCTQQQGLGVGQQRTEVSHGAYAHEDQAGVQAGFHADIEDIQQAALPHDLPVAVIHRAAGIHESIPQLLVVQAAQRQVAQQAAESNAHQQQRLKFLDNAHVQQDTGDDQHHQVLPTAGGEAGENGIEAGALPQV